MVMRFIYPFLLISLLSLFHSSLTYCQRLIISGSTTIHLIQDGPVAPFHVVCQVYHSFPAYDVSEVSDSMSSTRNQLWLQCPIRVAQNGYLFVGEDKLKLLMIPGDTIHIRMGSSSKPGTRFSYVFSGKTKAEQLYYQAKKQLFPVEPAQMGMNAGMNSPNLVRFRAQLDSLYQAELTFWQHYQRQHALPIWFSRFESDAIRYSNAMLCLYMSWYQRDYQKKKQTIPADYFKFLGQIQTQNLLAQYDYGYLNFLREYIGYKVRTSGLSLTNRTHYQIVFDQLANRLLGKDIGGFFRLWRVSNGAQDNPEQARTELVVGRFPKQYQYLVTYLKQRSAHQSRVLKPGDKAPIFFLSDLRDSLVSLTQFKGKVVYLCFWFATCGGCIHEFPFENQLVTQFKDEPVEIVSICTLTHPDQWRATIKKVGLKTRNLLANSAWQKLLEEKYAISVYPHYVLIDADGRIVENFATRPSHNAAAKIKQVVAKISSH